MFYLNKNQTVYTNKIEPNEVSKYKKDLYFPVEVDTEFQTMHFPYKKLRDRYDLTLTVQFREIDSNCSWVFSTPELYCILNQINSKAKSMMPVCKQAYYVLDFISHLNCKFKVVKCDKADYRLYIDHYGFFLVADFLRLFKVNSEWIEEVKTIILRNDSKKGTINFDRRLRAYTRRPGKIELSYVALNQYVEIDGLVYQIFIGFSDNCAIQGNLNYETLCRNTNVRVKKDLINQEEKGYMLERIIFDPISFLEYASGDVYNYKAWLGHCEVFKKLYIELGLQKYYSEPKPTIGATVNGIFRSAALKAFGFSPMENNMFTKLAKLSSHEHLVLDINSTALYLAKTNGGRCYNNRPDMCTFKGPVVDVDIKSCYGSGLRIQNYPIGRPVIIQYKIDSLHNKYNTLKKFLALYEKELVYGLWFARISTTEELTFDQDLFPSWFPPKNLKDIVNTETTLIEEQGDEYLRNDDTRIYSRELHLSPLQDEGLEWIRYVLTREQREEFLDKCVVVSAIFYPKSQKCSSKDEVVKCFKQHQGKNECFAVDSDGYKIYNISNECHKWTSINLGSILVDRLLELRSLYSKENPDQKRFNTLIKLVVNTIYGDLVSPYFSLSNTTVGNNITGRARSMAWYMEKSLNGIQTITDGCCFLINEVTKSRYSLNLGKINRLKYEGTAKGLIYNSLHDRKYTLSDVDDLRRNDRLVRDIHSHIKKCFPKIRVINLFSLEIKEIVCGLSTHGASNYMTVDCDNMISRVKMRSYKDVKYLDYEIQDDDLIIADMSSNIIRKWLMSIYKTPNRAERPQSFVQAKIIKTNNYRMMKRPNHVEDRDILPGNTKHFVRLVNECSISTFLFRTDKQYRSWLREYNRLKRKTKQSYEREFTVEDEGIVYIDYLKMIGEINSKILNNEFCYFKRIRKQVPHPRKDKFEITERYIKENESTRNIPNENGNSNVEKKELIKYLESLKN